MLPATAVREAARLVAPDGRLLIVDFAPHAREELRAELRATTDAEEARVSKLMSLLVKAFALAMEQRTETYEDQFAARSRRTRITILSRTIGFLIVFVTVALVLFGIPAVRNIGVTLMASGHAASVAVPVHWPPVSVQVSPGRVSPGSAEPAGRVTVNATVTSHSTYSLTRHCVTSAGPSLHGHEHPSIGSRGRRSDR